MQRIDYQYLRPKKAALLKEWSDRPVQVREDPGFWQGNHATILPLRPDPELLFGRGGLVDSEGTYLELSGIPRRLQYGYPFENPDYRDEKVVYCGYLIHHWGHFLIEAVTRLWYFLENDDTIDHYVFFLKEGENREIKGNYREFLELLGIWDKLEFISRPTTYREVIVPERGMVCLESYSPKLRKVFDTVAENVVPQPGWETPEKIFYSRSQLKKGLEFEFGYEIVDDFFAKNGYTILYPEKVPLSRMIHYIRNSKVVASLSGSLPHNMLFANQGQKLECVERLVMNIDNQTDVNRLRELDVTYIDANIPLYPVGFAGPIVMGWTPQFQTFAQDRGYQFPDSRYMTAKHYRDCFVKYMAAYRDLFDYRWYMEDWYGPLADSLYEGFQAGMTFWGDYVNRKLPYRWYHYFEFHYWKQFAKRLLGR